MPASILSINKTVVMFTSHFHSEQKPIPVGLNLDLVLVDMELELLLLVLELEPIGLPVSHSMSLY